VTPEVSPATRPLARPFARAFAQPLARLRMTDGAGTVSEPDTRPC